MLKPVEKLEALIREWEFLGGLVDRTFRSLQTLSVYIAVVIAVPFGIGVAKDSANLEALWPFIGPVVMLLLFRMLMHVKFAYLQGTRLMQVESEMEALNDGQKLFDYGRYYDARTKSVHDNPLISYLCLSGLFGFGVAAYSTLKASQVLKETGHGNWNPAYRCVLGAVVFLLLFQAGCFVWMVGKDISAQRRKAAGPEPDPSTPE